MRSDKVLFGWQGRGQLGRAWQAAEIMTQGAKAAVFTTRLLRTHLPYTNELSSSTAKGVYHSHTASDPVGAKTLFLGVLATPRKGR